MFTKKDIQSLIDQYISGSLDEPGKEQLYKIIQDPAYEQHLADLMDDALEARLAGTYDFPEREERMKSMLLQQIHQQATPVRRMRLWWAAAAVIMILGSIYFWPQPSIPVNNIQAKQQMPMPGGNKAVLVLADGSVVSLDSSGKQEIMQGQTAIRQQNGQLQYIAQGKKAQEGFNTLRTPRGGQFQITLPDGTKVWLNSASSLRYPIAFQEKERVVELNGQGYFEIAQNAAQPFKVKVNGGTEVQVLGTHFDIMAYPDEEVVKTTLMEGAVRVLKGTAVKTLKPGQQAVSDPAVDHITVNEIDVNKVIDWKNGLFLFNQMDLPSILREVSRWYDVEIVYQAPSNKNRYGGGISRSMALADVLLFLQEGGANHFKIDGKKVIVLP